MCWTRGFSDGMRCVYEIFMLTTLYSLSQRSERVSVCAIKTGLKLTCDEFHVSSRLSSWWTSWKNIYWWTIYWRNCCYCTCSHTYLTCIDGWLKLVYHLFMRNHRAELTKYDKQSKAIWYFIIELKFQLWAYDHRLHCCQIINLETFSKSIYCCSLWVN